MNWQRLLNGNLDSVYQALEGLLEQVDDSMLQWKPTSGDNWMTLGQLLSHLATCGGKSFNGLITGDWGFPKDLDPDQMSPEEMLPPAEKLPTVDSVEAAKSAISADKALAYQLLGQVDIERLTREPVKVPWDNREMPLGARLLDTVDHLTSHKSQLFYYLKLQGKPVDTRDMWGMK